MRLLLCFIPLLLWGNIDECPVLYKGRVRPFAGIAEEWMESQFGHTSLPPGTNSCEQMLLNVHFLGGKCLDECPLFAIENQYLATNLELQKGTKASFNTIVRKIKDNLLKDVIAHEIGEGHSKKPRELTALADDLVVGNGVVLKTPHTQPWNQLKEGTPIKALKSKRVESASKLLKQFHRLDLMKEEISSLESGYYALMNQLISENKAPKEIAKALNQAYPDKLRLKAIYDPLKMLPSKDDPTEWYSLKALKLKKYDPETGDVKPLYNFTLFPNETFSKLQNEYLTLNPKKIEHFGESLKKAYKPLQGRIFTLNNQGQFSFPSTKKLRIEAFYLSKPVIASVMILFSIAAFLTLVGWFVNENKTFMVGFYCTIASLLALFVALGLRMYILGRPPVATMYETLLFTPAIATSLSLILYWKYPSKLLLASTNFLAITLLAISSMSGMGPGLENVQPVLNSNYWLTIHVLMIVSSYGVFVLGGLLAHIYLVAKPKTLIKPIVVSLYLGVVLLISGTLLGGMWASQSWGRFWDWDPKESWAFISSLLFLVLVHLYRFKKIKEFGLCIGYIIGLVAITFTWYGVNYILSTGLHSYGFSSGGILYYLIYLGLETAFCVTIAILHLTTKEKIEKNSG